MTTVKAKKSRKKMVFAVISGTAAFATSFLVVVVGVYITCFFNDVTYILPVVLAGALKVAFFTGVIFFLLQLLAGTRKS